jgi:glucokinase
MILAGDIGGTKTVIGLFDKVGGNLRQVRDATYQSKDHHSLEELLGLFLRTGEKPPLHAGCFGVAGTVIDGKCRTTNLPWQLDERELATAIGTPQVKLLNDLEAAAYGMLHLGQNELCALNPGLQTDRQGHVAVIAAGTGLGEAILYWDGSRHYPLASEGGHCDFAPQTDQQIDLLRYLQEKFGSWLFQRLHLPARPELFSGTGLVNGNAQDQRPERCHLAGRPLRKRPFVRGHP